MTQKELENEIGAINILTEVYRTIGEYARDYELLEFTNVSTPTLHRVNVSVKYPNRTTLKITLERAVSQEAT